MTSETLKRVLRAGAEVARRSVAACEAARREEEQREAMSAIHRDQLRRPGLRPPPTTQGDAS